MSIEFIKSTYYHAQFSGSGKYTTEKDLRNEIKKNPLKMSYGDVNPLQYKKGGVLGFRKITAIPLAATATVEAIYHFVKALFFGCQSQMKMPNAAGKSMQQMILVKHTIVEAMGRLKIITNDKMGQFEVERAQFEKTCTYLSQSTNQAVTQQYTTQPTNASNREPSDSLEEFFNLTKEKRDHLIDNLTNNETLKKYVKEDDKFIDYMQSLDNLKCSTCEEFSKPIEDSKFKILTLSDNEVLDMNFQEAWKSFENGDLSGALIKFRLERMSVPYRANMRLISFTYSIEKDSESTLRDVGAIHPQNLFNQIKKGTLPSRSVINFISFEQLNQLEVEKIDFVLLSYIISEFTSSYFLNKWLNSYQPKFKLKIVNQLKKQRALSRAEKAIFNNEKARALLLA